MTRRVAAVAALSVCIFIGLTGVAHADDAACIDANEKAITLRRDGKLHDALKQLAICAAPACPREITEECTRRARGLDEAMPTLVLSATDAAGNDVVTATVTVDGTVIAEQLDGRPISLDPGPHVVKVEGSGAVVEKTLLVRESEKGRRENFVLARPAPPGPPAPETSGLGTQKTLAIVSGGVGALGIVVGSVFGLVANGKKSTESSDCSSAACPNHDGAVAAYGSAKDFATGSTIGFVAGVAFLATGVVLYLTAPKSQSPSVVTTGGAPLRWTF